MAKMSMLERVVEAQLTAKHLQMMKLLADHNGLTGSALAPLFDLSVSQVSRLALRLVELGFATRNVDPDDLRYVRFVPTKTGMELADLITRERSRNDTRSAA